MKTLVCLVGVSLVVLATTGCSDNSTTTSPSTATSTSPTTAIFASHLAVHGSTTRTFTTTTAGTIRVTLSTLGDGSLTTGLGVGVPATSAPCSLTQSVVTGPASAPQIVAGADAGTYCVQIWDTGGLTEDTAFSLTLEYP